MIVITDLDGTLLDGGSYSFEPARPALEALKRAHVPLILCTSKTREETEFWRRALDNVHPFIVENGGAVFVPEGYFAAEAPFDKRADGYGILEFGRPYAELREVLEDIRAATGFPLRGFGDMTAREIAERCGFSREEAVLAAAREYDEPFEGIEDGALDRVVQEALSHGCRVVRGGRFHHLVGGSDKGRAVRALRSLYEADRGPQDAVALGDSANDVPMLRAVDIPVIVRRPDGTCLEAEDLSGPIVAPYPGPEGWREAILAILGPTTRSEADKPDKN